MQWYNKTTNQFYSKGPLKTKDGTIFNPSEETLRKYGFEVFIQPAPQPTPPPMPSELRRKAYQLEVDEKSISYVGYKADAHKARKDGNEALAEQYEAIADSILEQIGEKKAEIRERYPDEVTNG